MKTSFDLSRDDYDEPVFYCGNCHSLAIVESPYFSSDDEDDEDEWDGCYCNKCGSADVKVGRFGDWLREEEIRERKKKELEWRR